MKKKKKKVQDSAELILMRSNSYFTYQPQNFLLFQKINNKKLSRTP